MVDREDDLTNYKQMILSAVDGEVIEGIVINTPNSYDMNDSGIEDWRDGPYDTLLHWNAAQQYLDYEFDTGYGTAGCHYITLWTPTRVIYTHEYDGSITLHSVPRNPRDYGHGRDSVHY